MSKENHNDKYSIFNNLSSFLYSTIFLLNHGSLEINKNKSKEKENKRLEKRIQDIPKGDDQEYNSLSKVRDMNKRIEEITESIIGKKVDQAYQDWLRSPQMTPFTSSLNQAEKNIFGRIIKLIQIREEKIENEISDVEYDLERSQSYLDYANRRLEKLEEKYGKDAIRKVTSEWEREPIEEKPVAVVDITAAYYDCVKKACLELGGQWVAHKESRRLADKMYEASKPELAKLSREEQIKADFLRGYDKVCYYSLPPMLRDYRDNNGCHFNDCESNGVNFLGEGCAATQACDDLIQKDLTSELEKKSTERY